MMSQNRQSGKKIGSPRKKTTEVNTKAEEELKAVMDHLEQQDELMLDILRRLEDQHRAVLTQLGAGNLANSPA